MIKSELIEALAVRFPKLVFEDSKESVNLILGAIAKTVGEAGRVEIRGFGSFSLSKRVPRLRHNPQTREQVMISAKQVPRFKAGKELLRRINADTSREESR